jgi:predicted dehydrogenase
MKKILIFGAGSIGNHMAHASMKLNFKVYITDINQDALVRMKNIIYKNRYGKWDSSISQIKYNDVFKIKVKFDLIIIGTPPNTHLDIYYKCKKYLNFNKILIEKPLCNYNDSNFNKFIKINNKNVYCGYNHSVSDSFIFFIEKLLKIKKINSIEVFWKEGWNGILGAHFWLKNEFGSYLGNYKKGGGALQEHSHGLHLLLLILNALKIKIKNDLVKSISLFKGKKNKYDFYTFFSYFKKDILIKYETDLITSPSEKKILVKSNNMNLKWLVNFRKNYDAVKMNNRVFLFKKTRSKEFENELKLILLDSDNRLINNLKLRFAIDVLKLIRALFKKHE